MMKRSFVLLLALLGCGPNFESGKTQCSDKLECPGGYTCGSEQKGGTPLCYSQTNCGGKAFFCKWANVCAAGPAQCPDSSGGGGSPGGSSVTGPSSCTDAQYPVYCPALGSTPAGCWEANTDCSTAATCSDGVPHACTTGRKVYCAGQQCCVPPAAGGECNVPACGCASGQVCYPDTVATGLTCITSNGIAEGAECTGKACAAGSGCFGSLCRRYCQTASDCLIVDGARSCDETYWAKDQPITGVSVCSRVCDPVSPQNPRSPLLSCPAGFGCTSGDGSPGASDCIHQTGTLTAGATCTATSDCAPGYYCTNGSICNKYCFTSADCPSGISCNFFATPQYAGTTQVGYCK